MITIFQMREAAKKEERLTDIHNYFFLYVFLSSVSASRWNYYHFVALNSPTVITLQLQVFFINTWLYVSSYVLLDLKVHPSANKFYSSIIMHCLISDTYGIHSHQSCCIYFLCVHVKKFCEVNGLYRMQFVQDFILQLDSVTYYSCKGRVCSILAISPANYWAIYFREKKKDKKKNHNPIFVSSYF